MSEPWIDPEQFDRRRLVDNLMSVSIMGFLLGWLGRVAFDWPGVIIALVAVFVALLVAVRDARVEP